MKTRLAKFKTGMMRDPLDAIQRTVGVVFGAIGMRVESLLLLLYRALVFPLPSPTKAGLKHYLKPKVRLDYQKHSIFLTADSRLSLHRARACEKEPETVRWIEECVKPNDVFYDVGANVGAYSLIASKFLDGQVAVYAFEPGFSTYDQLCRNIVLNHCETGIRPFMVALNDATTVVEFEYHSLEAGDAEHALLNDGRVTSPMSKPVYRQRILAFSLDDLISKFGFPKPNHIKLDVDGSELAILEGAAAALRDDALKTILVEVRREDGQAEAVERTLCAAGFTLDSTHDRGDGIIWNYIFKKEGYLNDKIAHDR
jgi:FkbM family methyltransferase